MAEYEALRPEAAVAFVEMLERSRRDTAWRIAEAAIRQMGTDNAVPSILRRQAELMESIRTSFERTVPFPDATGNDFALLPDFTGDDYSQLESAVLSLFPATAEEVQNVEHTIADASADPEARKIIARFADHMPDRSEIARMTTWAGFLVVAAYMYEIAPGMDANRIAMLAVIVAVWTVIVQQFPKS